MEISTTLDEQLAKNLPPKLSDEAIALSWKVNQWATKKDKTFAFSFFPQTVLDQIFDELAYCYTPITKDEQNPADFKRWGKYRRGGNGELVWVEWPKTREHTLRSIRASCRRYHGRYGHLKRVVSLSTGRYNGKIYKKHVALREAMREFKLRKVCFERVVYSVKKMARIMGMSVEELQTSMRQKYGQVSEVVRYVESPVTARFLLIYEMVLLLEKETK